MVIPHVNIKNPLKFCADHSRMEKNAEIQFSKDISRQSRLFTVKTQTLQI